MFSLEAAAAAAAAAEVLRAACLHAVRELYL